MTMTNRLPYKTFLKSFTYAPRIAVNLFIVNKNGEVLLTKRAKEPFKDYWHFPGSFLLKDEKISECISRIFKDELGVLLKNPKAVSVLVFENIKGDPRGHVIDLYYKISIESQNLKVVNDTAEIKFFKNLPAKIGFNHREVLRQLDYP